MRKSLSAIICFALAGAASAEPQAAAKPELLIQMGHTNQLRAAAFSRDGKYVATASDDNAVGIWNAATGQEIRLIKGHTGYLSSVAFSPDGKTLATGSGDATARLWDPATGKELRVLKGHEGYVSAVAFSPNGKLLATAGMDHDVRLWNPATGEEVRVLKGHEYSLDSVAFSPNGKILATASGDNTARLWNTRTGEELLVVKSSAALGTSVAFSPDGKSWAIGSTDGTVRILKTATGEETGRLETNATGARSVSFSPDGRSLAAISGGTIDKVSSVYIWDLATGAQVHVIQDLSFRMAGLQMNSAAFSPDGKSLLTTSNRSFACLWSTATGELIREFKGQQSTVESLAFSPDGKSLATGLLDKTARIWDTATGEQTRVLAGHPHQVLGLAFSPDGKTLATGSVDSDVRLWETATGKATRILKSHANYVNSIAFTPDGRFLATGGGNTSVQLWDTATGEVLRVFEGHTDNVRSLTFSPDGRYLASAADAKTVVLWDAATGAVIRVIEGNWASSVVFSPDSALMVTAGSSGSFIYKTATGEEVRGVAGPDGVTVSASISPDGKTLATGGLDKIVRLWDMSTGQELRSLVGHAEMLAKVAFSPDGKSLASAASDGVTILWDPSTGKELCRLVSMEGKGWAVISPDGFFDGSPEGLRNIRWTVGMQSFPLEAFSEGYYVPGLMGRLLAGTPVSGAKLPKLSDSFALPPSVTIVSPRAGAVLESADADVTVKALDQGGGVDEIRLYQNGKAVSDETRGMKGTGREQTFHVTLVDGDNVFRALALSRDRIESNPVEVKVSFTGAQKRATLHVVTVGINEYKNSSLNLNYAQPDAKALADFFAAAPHALFKETRTHELFNASATKAAILAQLAELKSALPQDVVMIYLAGHGDTIGNAWYFIPYDLVYPEREESVKAQGLSSAEILDAVKAIGAQKVLLLLDACKSGEALQAFAMRGVEDRKALSQLARASGIHLVAASTKDQFASEVKALGHGVFTYTLLEGLKGGAAKDGVVTVRELLTYVENQLPEVSRKYKAQAQYPVVDSRGMDFPITTK